jgi:ATP-grasp domain
MATSPFVMLIDKIEGFRVLDHYGIRVVRARYVDSAEDVVAFAARRDAEDDQPIPVELRVVDEGRRPLSGRGVMHGPLLDQGAIRRAYADLAPRVERAGGRIVAANAVPAGTDIAITGRSDEALGKCLTVRSAVHCVQRMVPLDEGGAEALARNMQAFHHHGASEQVRRMLEHLLLRVSTFFEDAGVESFDLNPVRLHENGYTVLDATIRSRESLYRSQPR